MRTGIADKTEGKLKKCFFADHNVAGEKLPDTEVTRIRIDDYEVGIVGLNSAIAEALVSCSMKKDSDVARDLLESLSKKNYIPSSAQQKYSEAFLHEFKRMRGGHVDEIHTGAMQIKILGPGCYQCDTLEKTVIKILGQLECPASVEHITDIKKIASMGLFSTPALMINGKIVMSGFGLSETKIRDLIKKFVK